MCSAHVPLWPTSPDRVAQSVVVTSTLQLCHIALYHVAIFISPLLSAGRTSYILVQLDRTEKACRFGHSTRPRRSGVQLDATLPHPLAQLKRSNRNQASRKAGQPLARPTGLWVPKPRLLMKDNASCRTRGLAACGPLRTIFFSLSWACLDRSALPVCFSPVYSFSGRIAAHRSSLTRCLPLCLDTSSLGPSTMCRPSMPSCSRCVRSLHRAWPSTYRRSLLTRDIAHRSSRTSS
jgi:hypothetical protein